MTVDPTEVDAKLVELADLLERQAKASYRQAVTAAETEAEYRAAVATTQLIVRDEAARQKSKLTDAHAEAKVVDQTVDLLRKRLVERAKADAARDSMFATRARLDALRSVAAGLREAAKG